MTKLTKTQAALLAQIDASPFKRTCVEFGVDRRGRYGTRLIEAANALVRAGIVERVGESSVHRESVRGRGTVHYGVHIRRKELS